MTGTRTAALMFQGTGSEVGKSLLVAGLARAFARRGLSVRPFKPQNMSNNAAVAGEGEIGRAQALQARACGVAASVHMNPVLLKPQSDTGAQIVVQGRVFGNATARGYRELKPQLMPKVLESFAKICGEADLVLVEGAGSAAEINLRDSDIANMGFACAADVPVVLVGDIDRGGVIASLVGTHALLAQEERARLRGFLVNKFRGDVSLFSPALAEIQDRTGMPCFGIVPFFPDARRLPAEDGVVLDSAPWRLRHENAPARSLRIAVPRLPRIANFDDLDPLAAESDVAIDLVEAGRPLPLDADAVILPGSKATVADLEYLRAQGWDIDIAALVRRGARVLGLCGGYQMLGKMIRDPDGIEGAARDMPGLGLLDIETTLTPRKRLRDVSGVDCEDGVDVSGYEMHMGETTGPDCARPMFRISNGAEETRHDGARSADGRVGGTYVHGLFAGDSYRQQFLTVLSGKARREGPDYEARIERVLDGLADHIEAHLDLDRLWEIADAR
jgi:adenosylcobyric acid synthase